MGTGGAPEGVLTAAALRCLNGHMQARLVPTKEGQEERMKAMGITDVRRIYSERDLAPGPDIMFAACGVTSGNLLDGIRFFGHGCRTHSVLMSSTEHSIRFIDSVMLDGDPNVIVEF
jgi:fructose-1,6-bisphosphatase II